MLKVKKKYLILITSVIWLIASFILSSRAYQWVELLTDVQLYLGIFIAIVLSAVKVRFIFRKITLRNIDRIMSFRNPTVSIWEFHQNRDKILIVFMILIGIILRHSPYIPKFVIFPIYLGIGVAMFYVCILYVSHYFKKFR